MLSMEEELIEHELDNGWTGDGVAFMFCQFMCFSVLRTMVFYVFVYVGGVTVCGRWLCRTIFVLFCRQDVKLWLFLCDICVCVYMCW